jgi:ribonuclease P protein component
MLARQYRLPATTRLPRAHFTKTELFRMNYAENKLGINRYGFVVRKSVDKRAVIRNRIRRVFRSCIEELHKESIPGYDMLFFLEKGIIDKRQADLRTELHEFLQQLHLLS